MWNKSLAQDNTSSESDASPDSGTSPDSNGEPEYKFEGFKIDFSKKVILTPRAPRPDSDRKGRNVQAWMKLS